MRGGQETLRCPPGEGIHMKAHIAILAILLLAQSASIEGFQMTLPAPRLESSVSIEAALHQRRSLREYADRARRRVRVD
jgi:hypothetical protein